MPETTKTFQNGNGGCCICCTPAKTCYCGCCPCVPAGPLTFSVLDCTMLVPGEPAARQCEGCIDGWTFQLAQQPTECIVHTIGDSNGEGGIGGCAICGNEYNSHSDTTDDYPEAWGFSGTVCGDCSTTNPPFESASCGGMALRASLCCCKTGIPESTVYTTDEHPCPMVTASTCKTVEDATCSMNCFWFGMTAYEDYDIDGDSVMDSPCSPCSAVQTYFGGTPGMIVPGDVQRQICFSMVTGQCYSSTIPNNKFMLAFESSFTIRCDCHTGLVTKDFFGNAVSYSDIAINLTALIHE